MKTMFKMMRIWERKEIEHLCIANRTLHERLDIQDGSDNQLKQDFLLDISMSKAGLITYYVLDLSNQYKLDNHTYWKNFKKKCWMTVTNIATIYFIKDYFSKSIPHYNRYVYMALQLESSHRPQLVNKKYVTINHLWSISSDDCKIIFYGFH